MVEISASILGAKEEESAKIFYNLEVAKIDYFHIDVMDGKFVENNTVEKMNKFSNILKQITTLPLDVHLMVEDIETYVKLYSTFEPNIITFHFEACKDKQEVFKMIDLVKSSNIKVGIAISPKTEVREIYEFLPYINTILVMTVEPGKGGQPLIPETLRKIKILKEYLKRAYNLKIKRHLDSGCELYLKSQEETYAGASGPVALPLYLFNKILKEKKYKKILLIGTGSLHNPFFVNQKLSIPAVAHAVSLEVI